MSDLVGELRKEEERLAAMAEEGLAELVENARRFDGMRVIGSLVGSKEGDEPLSEEGILSEARECQANAGDKAAMLFFTALSGAEIIKKQEVAAVYRVPAQGDLPVEHYFLVGPRKARAKAMKLMLSEADKKLERNRRASFLGLGCKQQVVGATHPMYGKKPCFIANILSVAKDMTGERLEILLEKNGVQYKGPGNLEGTHFFWGYPHKENPDDFCEHAVLLIEKGDYARATKKIRTSIREGPGNEEYMRVFDEAVTGAEPKYDDPSLNPKQKLQIYDADGRLAELKELLSEGNDNSLGVELIELKLKQVFSSTPEKSNIHAEIDAEAKKSGILFEDASLAVRKAYQLQIDALKE